MFLDLSDPRRRAVSMLVSRENVRICLDLGSRPAIGRMFLDLSGRALTTASRSSPEKCSRTYLVFAPQLVACRDRKNVLEPICALVSAVDASSTQKCSWIYPELPDPREERETVGAQAF